MKKRTNHLFRTLLPGVACSFGVAVSAKIFACFLPQLGGATIAILFGILLGNTCLRQPNLAPGTKFSESRLLEYSVVLLGLTVTVQTIAKIGGKGILYVLLMMTLVLFSAYFLGRKLGFTQNMSLLMAGGNAICGSSAIGSIAPVIGAKEEEKGQIITLVNLLGTVMMLTLPFLGVMLFPKNILALSALVGGTLQSVGQVVAGASFLQPEVVQYAMLFKIFRIFLLVVVVLLFGKLTKHSNTSTDKPIVQSETRTKKTIPIPWYVLGFVGCCILSSTLQLPAIFHQSATWISSWFETTALAAIGLRLDLRKFLKEGPRFLIYGLGVGIVQTLSAVLLIFFLSL